MHFERFEAVPEYARWQARSDKGFVGRSISERGPRRDDGSRRPPSNVESTKAFVLDGQCVDAGLEIAKLGLRSQKLLAKLVDRHAGESGVAGRSLARRSGPSDEIFTERSESTR
jgi:hypothetical protein